MSLPYRYLSPLSRSTPGVREPSPRWRPYSPSSTAHLRGAHHERSSFWEHHVKLDHLAQKSPNPIPVKMMHDEAATDLLRFRFNERPWGAELKVARHLSPDLQQYIQAPTQS